MQMISDFDNLGKDFLAKSLKQFKNYKDLAERALGQITDDKKFYIKIDDESNSIAIIMHHLAGNMRSRWTDFFTSDGEKPDRNRPSEFDRSFEPSRNELMVMWDQAWNLFFEVYGTITPKDLLKTIYIRKEPHTVMDAILRQLTHYTNHIGQILFLAKHLEWDHWKHVTLERNAQVFDVKDMKKPGY